MSGYDPLAAPLLGSPPTSPVPSSSLTTPPQPHILSPRQFNSASSTTRAASPQGTLSFPQFPPTTSAGSVSSDGGATPPSAELPPKVLSFVQPPNPTRELPTVAAAGEICMTGIGISSRNAPADAPVVQRSPLAAPQQPPEIRLSPLASPLPGGPPGGPALVRPPAASSPRMASSYSGYPSGNPLLSPINEGGESLSFAPRGPIVTRRASWDYTGQRTALEQVAEEVRMRRKINLIEVENDHRAAIEACEARRREKFAKQLQLPANQWGSFAFTNDSFVSVSSASKRGGGGLGSDPPITTPRTPGNVTFCQKPPEFCFPKQPTVDSSSNRTSSSAERRRRETVGENRLPSSKSFWIARLLSAAITLFTGLAIILPFRVASFDSTGFTEKPIEMSLYSLTVPYPIGGRADSYPGYMNLYNLPDNFTRWSPVQEERNAPPSIGIDYESDSIGPMVIVSGIVLSMCSLLCIVQTLLTVCVPIQHSAIFPALHACCSGVSFFTMIIYGASWGGHPDSLLYKNGRWGIGFWCLMLAGIQGAVYPLGGLSLYGLSYRKWRRRPTEVFADSCPPSFASSRTATRST